MYQDVYVFCEQRDGNVQNIAYELIGKARELADSLEQQAVQICLDVLRSPAKGKAVQPSGDVRRRGHQRFQQGRAKPGPQHDHHLSLGNHGFAPSRFHPKIPQLGLFVQRSEGSS